MATDHLVNATELQASLAAAAPAAPARLGYTPADQNMSAYTGDPLAFSSGALLGVAGVATGARIYLQVAAPIPRVWVNVVTAGVSLTAGACYGALWDAAGNVLDQSDDQASKWASVGVKDLVLPSGSAVRPAGWYDVGIWWNGTTSPQIARASQSALNNLGLAGRMVRFWTFGSGFTSTAPSLGTKTPINTAWWFGFSLT